MNCGRFQKQLLEYVEGTLSTGARAEAERHLAHCDHCHQALSREQRFAQVLSGSLRQETEMLTLRPEIRQNILTAARRKPAPTTTVEFIIGLWNQFTWQWAISVSVLLVASLVIIHFFRPRTSTTETARSDVPIPPAVMSPYPAVSIQIASRVPAWKFHTEGNHVIDALSDETVIASGTISPVDLKPVQQKPENQMSQ
jgi:anti-sigma factor RsiW